MGLSFVCRSGPPIVPLEYPATTRHGEVEEGSDRRTVPTTFGCGRNCARGRINRFGGRPELYFTLYEKGTVGISHSRIGDEGRHLGSSCPVISGP